jgi:ribosomal protein S18 acetylase RimI-like enzyme
MVEVRQVDADDLHIWIRLRIDALADAPGAFGDTVDQARLRTLQEWRETLFDRDGCLFVAYWKDLPAGMARVSRLKENPRSSGLYSMWVRPSARRNGVGAALMDAALRWAERQGVDEMTLFVAEGNEEAKRLYLKTNFVETGTRRTMRSNPAVQMEMMSRRIGPAGH